jgi:hypothetical protein
LGNNLKIEVSSGAIKKACAKNALKTTDSGKTDKSTVAHFSLFLATRFLEAKIEVVPAGKWKEIEAREHADFSIQVGTAPVVTISTALGEAIVRRHALNRFVERYTAREEIRSGMQLQDLPDHHWTKAWKTLRKSLPQALVVTPPPQEAERLRRTYGPNSRFLQHHGTQAVFIFNIAPHGLDFVTVLSDGEYCKITELPRQVGQRLVYA